MLSRAMQDLGLRVTAWEDSISIVRIKYRPAPLSGRAPHKKKTAMSENIFHGSEGKIGRVSRMVA
jgi:hypothetical protein